MPTKQALTRMAVRRRDGPAGRPYDVATLPSGASMKAMEIETARLRLRPWTAENVKDLHNLWTEPEVRKYLWDDVVITRERAASEVQRSLECFESSGFGQWTVFCKAERPMIGFCGFRLFGEPREVELLYGIAPAYWGRGFATEGARAMLRFGFEELGFDRVLAGADPPNIGSFRVMEKIGMTLAKRPSIDGSEAVYYGISRREFRPGDSFYRVRIE